MPRLCLKKLRERIPKGSLRDPFFYLGIIAVILFGTLLLGANTIFNSLSEKNLFLLASPASGLTQTGDQKLFLDKDKALPLEFPELILVQEVGLKAVSPPTIFTPKVFGALVGGESESETRKEIIEYIAEQGDSLWSIANKFNISIDTLIWANEIKSTIIRQGQKLLILPVNGVMHLVKEGDTIKGLAEQYKTSPEKILAFNDLFGQGDIFVNEVLIIPDGKMPALQPEIREPKAFARLSTNDFYGKSHAYPYGQCTWWVAQKRAIPAWGNAKDWLNNAMASGLPVCKGNYCIPKAGAVVSLAGNRVYGHVGYVEEVKGDKIVFSEMNYIGWGRMNYRTLRIGDPSIKGYIY